MKVAYVLIIGSVLLNACADQVVDNQYSSENDQPEIPSRILVDKPNLVDPLVFDIFDIRIGMDVDAVDTLLMSKLPLDIEVQDIQGHNYVIDAKSLHKRFEYNDQKFNIMFSTDVRSGLHSKPLVVDFVSIDFMYNHGLKEKAISKYGHPTLTTADRMIWCLQADCDEKEPRLILEFAGSTPSLTLMDPRYWQAISQDMDRARADNIRF